MEMDTSKARTFHEGQRLYTPCSVRNSLFCASILLNLAFALALVILVFQVHGLKRFEQVTYCEMRFPLRPTMFDLLTIL